MEKIDHIIHLLFSNYYEMFGSLTGLWCVWLAVKQNILNWPVAMLSVFCYAIFFYQSRFYSDAALQIVFFGFQVYGLYVWLFLRNKNTKVNISVMSRGEWNIALAATVVASIVWTLILPQIKPDQSMPAFDATTTCISITAIALQARKKIENWWWWIAVDFIYVPMYLFRGFWATAVLYSVFIILAVIGLRAWKKDMNFQAN